MKTKIIINDVNPMGAVRMTRRGKFTNESAKRYLNYKDYLKLSIRQQNVSEPTTKNVCVNMVFYMPIPESWSGKKKREIVGKFHNKKPDIDNIVKGLFDSINGLVWKDDNQVVNMRASKIYSDNPRIEFEVVEVE